MGEEPKQLETCRAGSIRQPERQEWGRESGVSRRPAPRPQVFTADCRRPTPERTRADPAMRAGVSRLTGQKDNPRRHESANGVEGKTSEQQEKSRVFS